MRREIFFHDLALLAAMYEEESRTGAHVLITKLQEIGNKWLTDREVPIYYATNFNSDQQRQITVALLKKIGLIEHVSDRGGFHVTGRGEVTLIELPEDWRNWHVVAPLQGKDIVWEQGKLAEDFRREL